MNKLDKKVFSTCFSIYTFEQAVGPEPPYKEQGINNK